MDHPISTPAGPRLSGHQPCGLLPPSSMNNTRPAGAPQGSMLCSTGRPHRPRREVVGWRDGPMDSGTSSHAGWEQGGCGFLPAPRWPWQSGIRTMHGTPPCRWRREVGTPEVSQLGRPQPAPHLQQTHFWSIFKGQPATHRPLTPWDCTGQSGSRWPHGAPNPAAQARCWVT